MGNRNGQGIFIDQNNKTFHEDYKDGILVERKPLGSDHNQTQEISQTSRSMDSDSPLEHFISTIKKKIQDSGSTPTGRSESRDKVNLKNWNVDVILEWLDYLNVGQYAEIFRSNKIDGKTIVCLKEKDLLDMGVSSKGHRMLLRSGIEKLKDKSQISKSKKQPSIHNDHKKKQFSSCSSEMKLRQYYKTVVIIDEVNSWSSARTDKSMIESKIKSSSAKIEMSRNDSSKDISGKSSKKSRNSAKNSMDIERPQLFRASSAVPKEIIIDRNNAIDNFKLKNSKRLQKSPTGNGKIRKKYSLDGLKNSEHAEMEIDSNTSAIGIDNENDDVPESVIARPTSSSDSVIIVNLVEPK